MIVSRVRGGLGNQLFIYAAGRSIALSNHTTLTLDKSWYATGARPFLLEAFQIEANITDADLSQSSDLKRHKQATWNHQPGFDALANDTLLDGWWQSERFFERHKDVIRRDLRMREPARVATARQQLHMHRRDGCDLVAVHVRRGDYLGLAEQGRFTVLGENYYRAAFEKFGRSARFVIFSDDPAWCREHLRVAGGIVLEVEDPIEAFAAMTSADHHIIANSTFSWWAAWCAEGPSSIVIAPDSRQWFGPTMRNDYDTSDVIPPRWTQLQIDGAG